MRTESDVLSCTVYIPKTITAGTSIHYVLADQKL